MAVINGNDVLLYIDGKPIAVSTGATLTLPDDYQSCLVEGSEQSYTFEPMKFPDYRDPEVLKRAVWHRIQTMPRKKKKRIMTLLRKGYTMNITVK